MNTVNVLASTNNQEPIRFLAFTRKRDVPTHGEPRTSSAFLLSETATDAIDNGLAIGQLQRIDKATTSPLEAARRVCVRPHNLSAGDEMTGMKRILQGSPVQQHGAGPRVLFSPLDYLWRNRMKALLVITPAPACILPITHPARAHVAAHNTDISSTFEQHAPMLVCEINEHSDGCALSDEEANGTPLSADEIIVARMIADDFLLANPTQSRAIVSHGGVRVMRDQSGAETFARNTLPQAKVQDDYEATEQTDYLERMGEFK